MIYLDNSATSKFKPLCAKLAFINSLIFYSANPGRSGHSFSLKVFNKILNTRILLSDYFKLNNPSNVIFTSGCTASLNQAILGCFKKNGHIIYTCYEHNSVIRTVEHLKQEHNITYSIVFPNSNGEITEAEIKKCIKSNTYMVITNHVSNVTGYEINISKIGQLCKEKNLIYVVDAAQSAGHVDIDMVKSNVNLLAVAGHKSLHGPMGVGALLVNDIQLKPIRFGGTGTDSQNPIQGNSMPEDFESGTINTPNIISLYKSVKYVNKNQNRINIKTFKLANYLTEELKKNKKIILYSKPSSSGVVSFNILGHNSNDVSNILNQHKICVRSGLHCAPLVHKHHKTLDIGMVRASLNFKNTKRQLKKFIKVINNIN